MPADLLDLNPSPIQHLLTWANAHLDGKFAAVIDASEFSAFWSTSDPAGMSRDEAASLALVLSADELAALAAPYSPRHQVF